jgi:hypothetical protein
MQSDKLTIEDIISMAKPHNIGGKRTVIENKRFILSIVGGCQGLYGDFENDFEIAIIDKKNGEFVTKLFEPEAFDDVMPYVPADNVVTIANAFIKNSVSKLD